MKALCFLLLCYIVPLFSKCGIVDPPRYNLKYTIQNSTRHVVQINRYLLGKRVNQFSTTLYYTQTFSELANASTESPEELEEAPAQAFAVDSLVLVFDEKKRAIFLYDRRTETFSSIPTSTVNLLRHSSYTALSDTDFLYTITEADYERAEPCDPCD